MPKSLPSQVSIFVHATHKQPALLFDLGIRVGDTGTTLYYTPHNQNITFDGHLYQARAISISEIQQSVEGQINRININIDNTDRDIAAYANYAVFQNQPINVKRVYQEDLSGSTLYNLIFSGAMEAPSDFGQNWVTITATEGKPLYKRALLNQYQKQCRHKFGGDFCNSGSSSDLKSISHLIGYWSMDDESAGNTSDGTQYSNDGALEGGLAAGDLTAGQIGNCYHFDGINDRVDCGNAFPLDNIGSDDFTIAFWAKEDWTGGVGSTPALSLLFSKIQDHESGGTHILVRRSATRDDDLEFVYRTGAATLEQAFSDITLEDSWHHYSFVVNSETSKVYAYIDASESTTVGILDSAGAKIPITGNMSWGAEADQGSTPFLGWLDDCRIYNRALTQNEITYIYNYNKTGQTVPMTCCGNIETSGSTWFTDSSMPHTVNSAVDDYWNFGIVKVGNSGVTYARIVKDFISDTSEIIHKISLSIYPDSKWRYQLFKGCPKDHNSCSKEFAYGPEYDNKINFGGFLHIGENKDRLL